MSITNVRHLQATTSSSRTFLSRRERGSWTKYTLRYLVHATDGDTLGWAPDDFEDANDYASYAGRGYHRRKTSFDDGDNGGILSASEMREILLGEAGARLLRQAFDATSSACTIASRSLVGALPPRMREDEDARRIADIVGRSVVIMGLVFVARIVIGAMSSMGIVGLAVILAARLALKWSDTDTRKESKDYAEVTVSPRNAMEARFPNDTTMRYDGSSMDDGMVDVGGRISTNRFGRMERASTSTSSNRPMHGAMWRKSSYKRMKSTSSDDVELQKERKRLEKKILERERYRKYAHDALKTSRNKKQDLMDVWFEADR